MMRKIAVILGGVLLASLADAGNSNLGGSGGGSTSGTANRCARFDAGGALTAATGDCTAGDSAGTVASFAAVTAGTNPNALLIGTGGSLGTSGAGSITATHAVDSGFVDAGDDGGTDPALGELSWAFGPGSSTVFQITGTKVKVRQDLQWPTPPAINTLTGTADVGQVPLAGSAITTISPPAACATHTWISQRSQVLAGPDTCAQPAFADLLGQIATAQIPDSGPGGTCTNCSLSFDSKGRLSAIASGSSAGEANTCSDLGGGLAVCTKVGIDLRFNTWSSADADLTGNVYTLKNDVVRNARTIATSGPLTGGGDLSANRTISIQADGITAAQIDETTPYAFADLRGAQKRNGTAVHITSCVGLQGNQWYDTTDARFKWCDANSGTPVDDTNLASLGDVTDVGDCTGGNCFNGANGTRLRSNTDFFVRIDSDANGSNHFAVENGSGAEVCSVDETGTATFAGAVISTPSVTGGQVCIGEPSGGGTQQMCFRQTNAMGADVNCDLDASGKIPSSCLTAGGQTRCITSSPVLTLADFNLGWAGPDATIPRKVYCQTTGTVTVAPTVQVQECDVNGASCGNLHSAVTCGATSGTTTTFTDSAIAADALVKVHFATAGTVVNPVFQLTFCDEVQ